MQEELFASFLIRREEILEKQKSLFHEDDSRIIYKGVNINNDFNFDVHERTSKNGVRSCISCYKFKVSYIL